MLHRQEELEKLLGVFGPLERGDTPANVLLVGPSGVGKTMSVRVVLRHLDTEATAYVNCWEH